MNEEMKIKVVESIAWGGDSDDETFADVLAQIQNVAPSARFRIITARPKHSGGWPIVEIELDAAEMPGLSEMLGYDFD